MAEPRAMAPVAYPALPIRAIDGDTVAFALYLGRGQWDFGLDDLGVVVRVLGINTREIAMPGGKECRAYVAGLLGVDPAGGPPATLPFPFRKDHRVHLIRPDKYGGRFLGHVTYPPGTDLATQLLAENWAVPWSGTGTAPIPAWPRITP